MGICIEVESQAGNFQPQRELSWISQEWTEAGNIWCGWMIHVDFRRSVVYSRWERLGSCWQKIEDEKTATTSRVLMASVSLCERSSSASSFNLQSWNRILKLSKSNSMSRAVDCRLISGVIIPSKSTLNKNVKARWFRLQSSPVTSCHSSVRSNVFSTYSSFVSFFFFNFDARLETRPRICHDPSLWASTHLTNCLNSLSHPRNSGLIAFALRWNSLENNRNFKTIMSALIF